jgi:hypothetical protein
MIKLLSAAISADVPVLLWGAPGTGKTSAIYQIADEAGAHLEVLIGSTLDPVDVGGLPVPDATGQIQISAPPWARRLRAAMDDGRPAWLLLDELSCSPEAVQAALLRVVQERTVAGVDLSGCRVMAAANPADSAAAGGWLAPATANRWLHLEWRVDPEAWCRGTLAGWGRAWDAATARVAASVAAWVTRSPGALLDLPDDHQSGRSWPSPRSWTAAIRAVGVVGMDSPLAATLASGCVGAAAASEWLEWAALGDLPDPEEILAGRAGLPTRGDRVRAAAYAVVAAALADHPDRDARIEAAAAVLADCRPDIAVMPARALVDALGGACPGALGPLLDTVWSVKGSL